MKTLIALSLLALTGCSTQQINRAICYGNGTCNADAHYQPSTGVYHSGLPQTVITSSGTFMVGRSASTGAINSVIRVSNGK